MSGQNFKPKSLARIFRVRVGSAHLWSTTVLRFVLLTLDSTISSGSLPLSPSTLISLEKLLMDFKLVLHTAYPFAFGGKSADILLPRHVLSSSSHQTNAYTDDFWKTAAKGG